MSQLSSQVQDPNWVSIPIVKFSHNTSPYGTKSFVWTHVNNRNDLDFVIRNARVVDDYGNYQERCSLKVTGGADVLEMQDLALLVSYCQDFDPSHGAEYPVDLVVKSPFMAMRYPKTINTVRRIQLKFRSDLDFKRAVTVMKDLGLRITSKDDPIPAVVPTPSPVPSLTSSNTVTNDLSHQSAQAFSRPASSAMMSVSSYHEASRLVASSPLKPTFKVPLRPDSAFSDSQGQLQVGRTPYFAPPITMPSPPVSSTPALMPSPPRARTESANQPPSQNHSYYVSQMERESQNRTISYPMQPHQKLGNINPVGSGSFCIPQMQLQQNEVQGGVEGIPRFQSASPFFSATRVSDSLVGDKPLYSVSQRPASTPIEHSDLHQTWIPPRRKLPFPKPRKTSNNIPSSKPELQATVPEPSPATGAESTKKPAEVNLDPASTPVKKPSPKKRVAQRKATNAKPAGQSLPNDDESVPTEMTEESIPKLASRQEQSEEPSPLAAKSAAAAFRPASAPGLVSKAIIPPKKRTSLASGPSSSIKRIKTVDQGTQTQTLSGRDHTSAQKITLADTASISSVSVPETTSPATIPANYTRELDAFIAKHNPQPKPKDLFETPGYADADEGTRQNMLNVFICENLENPDFIQLCRDAEFAWRRIGLGI